MIQLLSVIPMNFKLSEVTAAAGETDIRYLRVWADARTRTVDRSSEMQIEDR